MAAEGLGATNGGFQILGGERNMKRISNSMNRFNIAHRSRKARYRRLSVALVAAGVGSLVAAFMATPAFAAPALTASPNTGLANGQTVTISGSGYAKSSIGNVLECNDDANQPMVTLGSPVNGQVPVGCIPPSLMKLVTTDASGNVSSTFAVITGTLGPPCGPSPDAATCPATDSSGADPATDAAKYPCPPTAAQQAAGDTCNLTYGDATGESASATILFGSETASPTTTAAATASTTPPTTAAKTAPPTTAAAAAATAPTAAPQTASTSGSSLASTGPGVGVWAIGIIGVVLLLLGAGTWSIVEAPRRLLRRNVRSTGYPPRDLWVAGLEPPVR